MDKEDKLEKLIDRHFISGEIIRFENKKAVIRTDDGQEIFWPINNLAKDCEIGSKVRLILSTTKTEQGEREKIAKTLLNEILKADSDLSVGENK